MKYSQAFICMPGGFGSMDELFESLTLIQTERIKPFPIILVGSDFWSGLVDWLKDTMHGSGNISKEDLNLITMLDDADQVIEFVREKVVL